MHTILHSPFQAGSAALASSRVSSATALSSWEPCASGSQQFPARTRKSEQSEAGPCTFLAPPPGRLAVAVLIHSSHSSWQLAFPTLHLCLRPLASPSLCHSAGWEFPHCCLLRPLVVSLDRGRLFINSKRSQLPSLHVSLVPVGTLPDIHQPLSLPMPGYPKGNHYASQTPLSLSKTVIP